MLSVYPQDVPAGNTIKWLLNAFNILEVLNYVGIETSYNHYQTVWFEGTVHITSNVTSTIYIALLQMPFVHWMYPVRPSYVKSRIDNIYNPGFL